MSLGTSHLLLTASVRRAQSDRSRSHSDIRSPHRLTQFDAQFKRAPEDTAYLSSAVNPLFAFTRNASHTISPCSPPYYALSFYLCPIAPHIFRWLLLPLANLGCAFPPFSAGRSFLMSQLGRAFSIILLDRTFLVAITGRAWRPWTLIVPSSLYIQVAPSLSHSMIAPSTRHFWSHFLLQM